jgi:ubiquinone biosynthesis protein
MIAPRARGPSLRERDRRQEVKRRLAESGFLRGPSRLADGGDLAAEERLISRLTTLFLRLGGLFPCFGLYLSSRADLLPVNECGELARLIDECAAEPVAAIFDLLTVELERSPAEVYSEFDPVPCESRFLFQTHSARLRSGEAVTVRLVRPGVEDRIACDLDLLLLLQGAFAGAGRPDFPLLATIADFRQGLALDLDLSFLAEAMETLGAESPGAGPLLAPKVFRNLGKSRTITFERLEGPALADLAQQWQGTSGNASLRSLARRLCTAWLRQALLGRTFPVWFRSTEIAALPDGRIAFTGGSFAPSSSSLQSNLGRYLAAADRNDPDEVCDALLQEMTREGTDDSRELRLRLRQAAPFHESAWSTGGESLAEQLFLHWRVAREQGYRPRPPLLAFYRGLFSLAVTARQLDPEGDTLRESLEEVRLLANANQLRAMLSLREMRQSLERHVVLMMELPQKLDEALTLASEGRRSPKPAGMPERAEWRGSWVFVLTSMLALAAVALVTHHLAGREAVGRWAERGGALTFAVLGGLLLRAARWRQS